MRLKDRHLLAIQPLEPGEIKLLLDTAVPFKEMFTRSIKKVPTLRGKTVVNLFYEPSTRTRASFELAEKRLSADVLNIAVSTSSVVKGESLIDTAKTIGAMKADFVVIRHGMSGAPHLLAKNIDACIINAGDGMHEHPTQALLDLFTIREKLGRLAGLNVVIVGDIYHSRVARSNIWALTKMGAKVTAVAPVTLLPPGIENLKIKVTSKLDAVLPEADVVYVLRMQKERQKQHLFPSLREYTELFGITTDRMKKCKKDVMIMHPGPMNRGVEIASEVADSANSVITEQVTNGIAVRMASLYLLAGGAEKVGEGE